MRSLSARLALSLVVCLVTFFALQSVIVDIEVRRMTEQGIMSRLEHDMEDILAALIISSNGMTVDMQRVPAIYHRPFSGHYFQLEFDGSKPLRSRSLWDENLAVSSVGVYKRPGWPDGSEPAHSEPTLCGSWQAFAVERCRRYLPAKAVVAAFSAAVVAAFIRRNPVAAWHAGLGCAPQPASAGSAERRIETPGAWGNQGTATAGTGGNHASCQ